MRALIWIAALLTGLSAAATGSPFTPAAAAGARELAMTMDDLPGVSAVDHSLAHVTELTTAILETFARHRVPAIGFVNEQKLERDGAIEPARTALLRRWLDGDLELGNHTYSHIDLHTVTVQQMEAEVLRGERVTRELMAAAGKRLRFFRHPFLHTGRSVATRTAFEEFLAARGYTVAPVTVDNADYVFAAAYDRRVAAGDATQAAAIVDAYIDYMTRVVAYYEEQAVALLGRPMRQILLVHASALNARALPRWLPQLEQRGYRFVSLEYALADPAFSSSPDEYVGAGGITWLHRWALTAGKRGAFFAGEPGVPTWIQQASSPSASRGQAESPAGPSAQRPAPTAHRR